MDRTENECGAIMVHPVTGEFLNYCCDLPVKGLRKAEFTKEEEFIFKVFDALISNSLYNYKQHGNPKFVTSPTKAMYALAYRKDIEMRVLKRIVNDNTESLPEIKSAFDMMRLYIGGLQSVMYNMFEALNKYGEK